MLRDLLDTNIAMYVIKQRPVSALQMFNQHAGHMAISVITLAELLHGAEKSARPSATLAVVEDFCSRLEVLPYLAKAAQHYGALQAALETLGTPIGVNDLHFAAHVRSEGRVLVTHNTREFDRVPALQIEDWAVELAGGQRAVLGTTASRHHTRSPSRSTGLSRPGSMPRPAALA